MKKILVILGPTATGKTMLAALLVKRLGGELVSADSRQVFRGNDLETNKERPDVPIWLYDVVNPGQEFSVSHWVKRAKNAISDIHKRGKLPIVVGGSGLYIKALMNPFDSIDIPPDKKLREKNLSVGQLQKMIQKGSMNNSDWNNPRRLIRRIEISNAKKPEVSNETFNFLAVGLSAPLPKLYKRIDDHLKERRLAGMSKTVTTNEHAIARKQLTWFKKQQNIEWFDVTKPDYVSRVTKKVLSWYTGGAYEYEV